MLSFSKKAISIIFVAFLLISCGESGQNHSSPASYYAQHIDNHEERAASEEMPWHFHTGKGYVLTEIDEQKKIISRCQLSEMDSECKEKVYFFRFSEIMEFIRPIREIIESDWEKHLAWGSFNAFVSASSGKMAFTNLVTPEPTMITKVVAAGAGLVSGLTGLLAYWEGMKVKDALDRLANLDALLSREQTYVRKCRQLRADFLTELREDFGIQLVFAESGGEYIDSKYFFQTKKSYEKIKASIKAQERQQMAKPLYKRFRKNKANVEQKEYWQMQCGQLPLVFPKSEDLLFVEGNS